MTQLADLAHQIPSPEDFERLGREALQLILYPRPS
jgi:hypothetical protein